MRRSLPSPQPNIPGRGILAGYSARFWASLIIVGVSAGLAAAGFIALLNLVERVAWQRPAHEFLAAVSAASATRRVLVLLLAGVIAAAGTFLVRRLRQSGGGEVSEAIWLGDARLELVPSIVRGLLSIVTVGMGASLGREAAPQLAGAAVASELCERSKGVITPAQRRLLVAAGAGAGMAAVYNVPLGGALFALEVLLGTLALPLVLPALLTSLIATAVAWIVIPTGPTYVIGAFHVSAAEVVWAALVGPIAGLLAVAWVRLVTLANRIRPARRAIRLAAPIVIFAALGALAIRYPQLLGNGKDLAQLAFVGKLSLGLFAALMVLKPLATAACLASGSPGGLFTPTLALGVLFGAMLGHAWGELWPGSPVGSYALIGGGAVLAAAMQGPLAATVLMLELTHSPGTLTVPLLLAVAEATVLARLLNSPSIYSARLADPHWCPPPLEAAG
ncbi:MAG: chloride channel protein [Solirubrobacteraceae bacterium]|jgi:H+/Cl- antiporter ClcA